MIHYGSPMAQLLGVLKETLWLHAKGQTALDSVSFRISSKVSCGLLLVCSVFVSARQFFGDPIQCDAGVASRGVRMDVLESYCWMYAHFNIPVEYEGPCSSKEQRDEMMYNSSYQWVPIFLIFLAILFYLPRLLWLAVEGGLMKFLVKGTTGRVVEEAEEKCERLIEFFMDHVHNRFNVYFIFFVLCESLNLLVLMAVMWVTNGFLHHRYMDYGLKVLDYYLTPMEEQKLGRVVNPMCNVFPRIAACTYRRFGAAGGQESVEAICILGLNVINDKVFLVIWWWLLFLLILDSFNLLARCLQILSPRLRFVLIRLRVGRYFRGDEIHKSKLRVYFEQCSHGDWFVLYQLSKNLNRAFFMHFVVRLCRQINRRRVCRGDKALCKKAIVDHSLINDEHNLEHIALNP